jgi:hypothetical protein
MRWIEPLEIDLRAGAKNFGGDAQYGIDQIATLGYSEFEGKPSGLGC